MAQRERVLITGGAGFIGSHLADRLAAAGHSVVLFDNLEPQVHGALTSGRPAYLSVEHELVRGDIRDAGALAALLRRVDVVFHLAAMVGVGQSMYQVRRYTEVNTLGVANLLQLLVDSPGSVRKLIVASSMSIYGEGAYSCGMCGRAAPRQRPEPLLARRQWEPLCQTCEQPLSALPTDEDKPLYPTSIYAVNKRDHEEMCLAFGQAYRMPTVALRFFNVYGSRQALSNPYTGVAAIFCGRLLNGNAPLVFEDGRQTRDFVHVSDIAQACELAMASPAADGQVFNVGTGRPLSVLEVGEALAAQLGWQGGFEINEQFRAGDIRHCYADISRIRSRLGYEPRVRFEDGVAELVGWVSQQRGVRDAVAEAAAQLAARGLTR
ncbi:MAG: SDR family NAD(P)-dependent oxidoreductase [Chloroflexi bacterium]|nr:SDR family NAD(P)-dependent oxidoreductase [Chloroflexota bacterium]